jgi:CHAT domain-containing protein/tetratricopeptide (TPR) repeat protein
MIRYAGILILFVSMMMDINSFGADEKKWGKGKLMRYYRKHIARQKDIDKLEESLKVLIDHSDKNMRIFLRIQLATLYEQTGNYPDAEKLFIEALDETKGLNRKPFGSTLFNLSGTVYDSYEHLGYFYLKTGNLRRAEELFRESLQVRSAVFPPRSVHRVHPLVGLGSYHFRRGEYDKTYELFNEAFDLMNRATSTHYDYDNLYRLFLNDLVELCFHLKKNREAARYIEKLSAAASGAAKFNTKIARRAEIARIFELMARYQLYQGNTSNAQKYIDKANQFKPTRVASSDIDLKILKSQASLYWMNKNYSEASETFLKMAKEYRSYIVRNFVFMSEYEKDQFYQILKSDFDLLNSFAVDIQDQKPDSLFAGVYDNVINTKALLLNESIKRKQQILSSDNETLINDLKEWEKSKARLSAIYYNKDNQNSVTALEKQIEIIEKKINQQSGLFDNVQVQHKWGEIRELLKPGEAAIEVVRVNAPAHHKHPIYQDDDKDSIVYTVMLVKGGSDHIDYFILPEGNQLETKYLKLYRNSILGQVNDEISYSKFWLPIKKHLGGIKRVYFSPDGVFNQINLNTLKNPSNKEYVLDEVNLFYVTNTADLLRERKRTDITTAVLIGRPTYDFDVPSQGTGPVEKDYGLRSLLAEELASFREQTFSDLPGTEREISEIERTLNKAEVAVHVYKGNDATEEQVKTVKSPHILHIATHGFFVEDSANMVNPMIRSGVILAGVKNANVNSHDDGILTAYEATHLDLDKTELVVLSACETGLGEIRNGEGVYGLQRAIIVAGANNLLMSLWKVDDDATTELMTSLYSELKSKGNVEAFREAQLSLRKKYPHPFYWGAFIMLGY